MRLSHAPSLHINHGSAFEHLDPYLASYLYHWYAEFAVALSEGNEVWLISTHKPARLSIHH